MDLVYLQEHLQARLHDLRDEFQKVSGGKTVCEIGRSGAVNYPLKELEGKMQAATDVVRCFKEPDLALVQPCLLELAQKWEKLSEISQPWQIYKQAGLDEIYRVIEIVDDEVE